MSESTPRNYQRIEKIRKNMAELESRVTSLEREVEYDGLNLSLEIAAQQAEQLSKKAIENSEDRAKLRTKIEGLLEEITEHESHLENVHQIAQDNLDRYDQVVQQRQIAEERERAAIRQTMGYVNQFRKSA